jgi:hypothetical protein
MPKISVGDATLIFLYVLAIALSSVHLYEKPVYSMDAIQYMGNALLVEDRDIASVHNRVYTEVDRRIPPEARRDLLGHEPGAPEDQNQSRQERARNPRIFAEFLPLFAIRPLYNQAIWLLSKTGLGLVRSSIVLSVTSYFAIGIILLVWARRYATTLFASALALLVMISPPLTELGRDLGSDAMATLVAFAALYLIFVKTGGSESLRFAAGLTLLLVSIFCRTDFVVLAGPVLLVCWMQHRIELWQAGILAVLAVAAVIFINHFAGDYGIQMLYYRNFVGTPLAPAEMKVEFTVHDYFAAFRSGITLVLNSFFIPFLLVGLIGLAAKKANRLFFIGLAYIGLHFMILPNWQERWAGIFYLICGLSAATGIGAARMDRTATA